MLQPALVYYILHTMLHTIHYTLYTDSYKYN